MTRFKLCTAVLSICLTFPLVTPAEALPFGDTCTFTVNFTIAPAVSVLGTDKVGNYNFHWDSGNTGCTLFTEGTEGSGSGTLAGEVVCGAMAGAGIFAASWSNGSPTGISAGRHVLAGTWLSAVMTFVDPTLQRVVGIIALANTSNTGVVQTCAAPGWLSGSSVDSFTMTGTEVYAATS
jgi:hypothetical protein